MKENNMCTINGIMYHDPTGDLVRITSLINSLIGLVNDTYLAWDYATRINDISIRQGSMERLTDSINNLMLLVQSIDRQLGYDLRQKEGLTHAEE